MVAVREDICSVCERIKADHGGLIHPYTVGEVDLRLVVRCADCGSSGGQHKASCSKAVLCGDCGSGGRHRASCVRNTKPLKRPYCGTCGNLIRSDAHRERCEGVRVSER